MRLTRTARRILDVLEGLALRAERLPSQMVLAERAECTQAQVSTAMQRLADLGLITLERQAGLGVRLTVHGLAPESGDGSVGGNGGGRGDVALINRAWVVGGPVTSASTPRQPRAPKPAQPTADSVPMHITLPADVLSRLAAQSAIRGMDVEAVLSTAILAGLRHLERQTAA